ncbi:MAG TPA: ATP synthase F0 subunit B [Acidobacteriaceae bacterium]
MIFSTFLKRLYRWPSFALLAVALLAFSATTTHGQRHDQQPQAASSGETSTPVATVPEKKEEVRDENDEYRHSPTVRKLGSLIGLNAEQAATAFTIFNFLVLAIAVGFALLKMLPKTFRARTSRIQKQLVDARTATEEASARLNSVEARLSKLDSQIAAMRSQAEDDAAREERRIRASVEEEKSKILTAAEAEIHAATAAARRDIQQFAAGLAIEQAARKLIVTAETDRLLVEGFARQLTSENGGHN